MSFYASYWFMSKPVCRASCTVTSPVVRYSKSKYLLTLLHCYIATFATFVHTRIMQANSQHKSSNGLATCPVRLIKRRQTRPRTLRVDRVCLRHHVLNTVYCGRATRVRFFFVLAWQNGLADVYTERLNAQNGWQKSDGLGVTVGGRSAGFEMWWWTVFE